MITCRSMDKWLHAITGVKYNFMAAIEGYVGVVAQFGALRPEGRRF